MKTLKTTENLLELIGCHHRYQIAVTTIFCFIGIFIDSSLSNLSLMVSPPIADHIVDGKLVSEPLTYKICEESHYTINMSKSSKNWLLEFEVYCDKTLVALLTMFFYAGNVLGLISLQFFKYNSKETIIKIFVFIYSGACLLLLAHNYWVTILFNLIQGFCQAPLIILRLSTVTELTCNDYRSYFLNLQIISSLISPTFLIAMKSTGLDWRFTYVIGGVTVLVLNLVNLFVVVTNPRYLMVNNEIDEATEKAEYIRSFNRVGHHKEVADINELFDPNTSQILVPESVSHSIDHKEQEPKKTLLLNILIFLLCGVMNLSFVLIEQKSVANEPNFYTLLIIGSYSCIIVFVLVGFLMNTLTLGRKFTLVILNGIIIVFRLLNILFGVWNKYFYMIVSVLTLSTQIPEHALVMESFSNKGRIKYYGRVYLIAKITSIFCALIYENLENIFYQLLTSVFCIIILVYLIFVLEETNKKELKDY